MLVFGRRYLRARNDYIIPLINHDIPLDKLNFNNIKTAISSKIKRTNIIGNNYELYFDTDDLFKALVGDINYFYTRTLVQYINLKRSHQYNSPCWNIVSQYYFSFFAVTTLLRLVHRGNTYFNGDEAKNLSDMLTLFSPHGIVRFNPGNYKFAIEKTSVAQETRLVLSSSGKNGTHEQTWLTLNEFITELLNDTKNDEEFTILTTLRDITRNFNPQFPSVLRNKINYQAKYGMESIVNSLHSYDILGYDLEGMIREILKFEHSDNENYKVKISGLYGYYFFIYVNKLYLEYLTRVQAPESISKRVREYFKRFEIAPPDFLNGF